MDTGGDRGERAAPADDGGSDISRRRFVAGGLVAIGGASVFAEGGTRAQFSDEGSASGSVNIDAPPTLNYFIDEKHPNGNLNHVQYDIYFQVEWVSGFDGLNIYIDNTPNGQYDGGASVQETFLNLGSEGSVSTQTFWSHGGDTFEFIFDVSSTQGDSFQRVITDDADDTNDQGDKSEFQTANTPVIDSFTVYDNWDNQGGYYDVEYYVSNTSGFQGETRVRFEAQNWNSPDASYTEAGASVAHDTISYGPSGGKSRTWNITVEVVKQSGLVVDSETVTDVPGDGNNSSYTR